MTVGQLLRAARLTRLIWWWDRWGSAVAACVALLALIVAGSR